MLNSIRAIIRSEDLRKKILWTLFMLVVFRIGSYIPIPGINYVALQEYLQGVAGETRSFTEYIDLFAGGAFNRLSIFALGIMPYISASIIMQLLLVVFPALQKLSREGEYGRRKIQQYTRYGTVFLCMIQAYGITIYIRSLNATVEQQVGVPLLLGGEFSVGFVLLAVLTITTGTIFLMWLGELITEIGIGNGVSLLIFAGIIAEAPSALVRFYQGIQEGSVPPILALILFFLFLGMIAFSILITEGVRRIPLQYGKRIVGRRVFQGASQSLPMKVSAGNVMPIIFASSLMLFPSQLAQYIGAEYEAFAGFIQEYLTPGNWIYMIVYVALIIFFAYFYVHIQYNPKEIADVLKRNGGYIPGIRPGIQTEEYLEKILNRITLPGAILIAIVAIVPDLIVQMWEEMRAYQDLASLFGGTSLLIVVGVALDTLKQIESQLIMRRYEGFMDKKKKPLARYRRVVRR